MALPALIAGVARELRDRLARRFDVDLLDVRVFGSQARGEADEESDVDVLVLLRRVGWGEKKAVLDIAGDLFAETGVLLSPTVIDQPRYDTWRRQERPLVMDIERDGIRP